MKFLCSNCKAKYQISDEKVAGRKLRMTCRQCKSEIIIRGDARSGAAAPPPTDRKTLLDPTASVAPMLPTDEGWHVAIGNTAVGQSPASAGTLARAPINSLLLDSTISWTSPNESSAEPRPISGVDSVNNSTGSFPDASRVSRREKLPQANHP